MKSGRARLFLVSAAVVALDRLTKAWIEAHVADWEQIRVIPGFFQIVHTRNTGIAFGMFQGQGNESNTMLVVFSVLVMGFIAMLFWNASSAGSKEHWTLCYALALVLGGAVGNLYDRLRFGSVTDFLDFYLGNSHFPVFNAADSAITVGAGLLLLNLWISSRRPRG
jgi:signal peptidase II